MAIVHLKEIVVDQLPSSLPMHSVPVNGTTAFCCQSVILSEHMLTFFFQVLA
jgi:hypothetical protein